MHRIYFPVSNIRDDRLSIIGEKARYLTSVLRCRKGDDLIIFDGKGYCYRATILKADKKEVIAEVIEKFLCDTESHINVTLVQGLLKGEKMDMVIQKTTELGVKEIIPIVTVRSQLRETRRVARWRKIAEEASRQSGRSVIPVIYEPVEFNKFLARHGQLEQNSETETRRYGEMNGFIFWEEEGVLLKEAVLKLSSSPIYLLTKSPIYLFIGPEGGFTKEEVTLAKEKGLIVTYLGRRILRAETAAISAVTLVQFLLGDMG